jgi:hypothetical protein
MARVLDYFSLTDSDSLLNYLKLNVAIKKIISILRLTKDGTISNLYTLVKGFTKNSTILILNIYLIKLV